MKHADCNHMIPSNSRIAASSLLALVFGGCTGGGSVPNNAYVHPQVETSVIDESLRTHDFGSVVSKSGRTLAHRYRLNNTTGRDLNIIEVINRKTCCGKVAVSKTLLHPGEEADIEVILSVARGRFDKIVHETLVRTDPPDEIVLRTIAHAFPPLRFEEVASSRESVLLNGVAPMSAQFRVVAYGTLDDPPIDVERLELRSSIAVHWLGPKESGSPDNGVLTDSRCFVAMLDRQGAYGPRSAEIECREGKNDRYLYTVNWEIVPTISASPKMVVLVPHQREYRVLLRSQDGRKFRIERFEGIAPGVRCHVMGEASTTTQIILIEVDVAMQPDKARSIIAIRTDHPLQGRIEIPIVVLD